MSVRREFLRCLGAYARFAEEAGLLRIEISRRALPEASAEELGSLEVALQELRRLGAEGDLELAAALTRRVLRGLAANLPRRGPGLASPDEAQERELRDHLDELCRVILGEPPGPPPEGSGTARP